MRHNFQRYSKVFVISLISIFCLFGMSVKVHSMLTEAQGGFEATFYDGRINNGWNTIRGTFYYNNSEYGFSITFWYDSRTGKVSNATYRAEDYSASIKITSMTISRDITRITVVGPQLKIVASEEYIDQWDGTMTRGKHKGFCTMW